MYAAHRAVLNAYVRVATVQFLATRTLIWAHGAMQHTPLSPESKKNTWVACNPEGVQWVCLSPLVCRTTVGDVPTPGPAVVCVCLCVRVNEETHMHDVFSPAKVHRTAD